MGDDEILHQDDVEDVIEGVIEGGIGADQPAIANFVAITGGEAPTEAEFNALGAKLNVVLGVLRTAGTIET